MPAETGTPVPRRIKWVDGSPVPQYPHECEPHTPSPDGYLQWHVWAQRMERTHTQRQCKGCGLWAIWERTPEEFPADATSSAPWGEHPQPCDCGDCP